MNKSKLSLMVLGGLGIGSAAIAEQFPRPAISTLIDIRCQEDSLSPAKARDRLYWAKNNDILPARTIKKWLYTVNDDLEVILDPLPYYPLFGTWNGNVDQTVIWKPEAHGMPAVVPAGNAWIGACRSSCYTPDQKLLTGNGYLPISEAAQQFSSEIVTVTPDSMLGQISYQTSEVENYTVSFRSTLHDVITFQTLSGGQLQVTTNHPILDSDGVVREASTFQIGDSFILKNGEADPILSISENEQYYGKVYNVRPTDLNLRSNIVVVQGFLNGSSRFQNSYLEKLNRQILHSEFDVSLLP